jgi:hypothetical protein
MSTIRFTEDHEWIRVEDNNEALVGITDYAQEQLGELVYVRSYSATSSRTRPGIPPTRHTSPRSPRAGSRRC